MYFAASAIMTTVTTTNAAICSQKLLANPALLLVCVSICCQLPLSLIVDEPCGVRAFSTVTQAASLCLLFNDSVECPSSPGCFEIESWLAEWRHRHRRAHSRLSLDLPSTTIRAISFISDGFMRPVI
jgi:hypothetical protein